MKKTKQKQTRSATARKGDKAAASKQARGGKATTAQDKTRAQGVVLDGGMAQNLGVQIVSISKKRIVAEMPIDTRHLNRSGRVNGGALMAFADLVGATGTVANLPPGHRTTTLESKTNFFAAGEAPLLT